MNRKGGPQELPENLEMIQKAETFHPMRHRWNTNEEIASILIAFDKHDEWASKEVKIRAKSGTLILYSRKRVRYRRDGYCWKKRKDGKTTREDHMKLKVQGVECIYGCYVHSAILPTFHRRCYWLLQNPDIVLVHYLNVPYTDDNKIISPTLNFVSDSKKQSTRDDLISELKPMFFSENDPELGNELDLMTPETLEPIIQALMVKQRARVKAMEENVESSFSNRESSKMTFSRQGSKAILPSKSQTSSLCRLEESKISGNVNNKQQQQLQVVQLNTSNASTSGSSTPLIFNLSQLRNGNSILILNSTTTSGSSCLPSGPSTVSTRSTFASSSETTPAPITLVYSRSLKEVDAMNGNSTTNLLVDPSKNIPPQTFPVTDSKNPLTIRLPDGSLHATSGPDLSRSLLPESSSSTRNNIMNGGSGKRSFDVTRLGSSSSTSSTYSFHHQTPSSQSDKPDEGTSPSSQSEVQEMDFIESDMNADTDDLFNLETFEMLTESFPNLDDFHSSFTTMTPSNRSLTTTDHPQGLDNLNNNSILHQNNNNGINNHLNIMNGLHNHNPISRTDQNDSSSSNHNNNNKNETSNSNSSQTDYADTQMTPSITDYSPEWSYPEGGMKVLVTGPWFSVSHNYTIIFDGISVPTSLVQNGVLRCFSPAHEPGFVSLQVAQNGTPVSNSVIFEYRDHPSTPAATEDYFAVDDNVFKFCLLERLELLGTHVSIGRGSESNSSGGSRSRRDGHKESCDSCQKSRSSFEDRLIAMSSHVMSSRWLPCNVTTVTTQSLRSGSSHTDMSLLHLSAALGYSRLIKHLIRWRMDNPSIILEVEVDAFSYDANECTPLMWAISRGHREASLLLLKWNKGALNLVNKQGQSPISLGTKRGFTSLVREVEQLQKDLLSGVVSSSLDDHLSSGKDKDVSYPLNMHGFNSRKTHHPTSTSCPCHKNKGRVYYCPGHSCMRKSSSCDTGVEMGFDSDTDEDEDDDTGSCLSSQRSSFGNDCSPELLLDTNEQVLSFAEHVIAAIPDRIKSEATDSDTDSGHQLNESMDSFRFDYLDMSYRSGSSPTSSSFIHSPGSMNTTESPSPPPSADLCEFFSSRSIQKEFSSLTLSDKEQRELYEAARTIQKAYRVYQGRKARQQEQEKERMAATIIQSYYRRYRQYIYYKQMTRAAQVIQSQFRNYCSKRFKKCPPHPHLPSTTQKVSHSSSSTSSTGNECNMRSNSFSSSSSSSVSTPSTSSSSSSVNKLMMQNAFFALPSPDQSVDRTSATDTISFGPLKRTYSQRRQHQAARKIQQFLRQSKNKLQRERALALQTQ